MDTVEQLTNIFIESLSTSLYEVTKYWIGQFPFEYEED